MQWSEPADDLTCENYFRLVARRCKHEPLQLIIGEQEFLGLPMKVELGVLIPRLDTEVVALAAELLIKEHGYRTLLDLCCGTGAIGLALGKRTGIKATLSDISDKAVELSKENAIINAVKDAAQQAGGDIDALTAELPKAEAAALMSEGSATAAELKETLSAPAAIIWRAPATSRK